MLLEQRLEHRVAVTGSGPNLQPKLVYGLGNRAAGDRVKGRNLRKDAPERMLQLVAGMDLAIAALRCRRELGPGGIDGRVTEHDDVGCDFTLHSLDGLPNGGGPLPDLYLAGDVRANEQIGLTSMHVLFVREHNRLADLIRAANPRLSDEMIYQTARRLVGAEMQAITYREFLPLLLGRNALSPYRGYRKEVDPSIANMFSTVAFRVGHTMLNERLLRLLANGRAAAQGALPLAEAFFNPSLLQRRGALEALLRGLAAQRARAIDPFVVDAVRNFLFGAPGAGGFDLASLNIQRGRDHGLADYNSARLKLGLGQKTSFATISSDPEIQDRLETAYGSIDLIDPWVGGLAEDRWRDALVGEFFFTVLKKQFENLRDGDPFWYERDLDSATRQFIENLTLSRIIRLNTQIGGELPEDAFRARNNAPF